MLIEPFSEPTHVEDVTLTLKLFAGSKKISQPVASTYNPKVVLGHWSKVSKIPSLSSSLSALFPMPSASVSIHSSLSNGKASLVSS